MGKSLVSKAASAKNKKLGVAKSKSTTVGKKIVKKRVEIDLEQPKDRDPIDPNTTKASTAEAKKQGVSKSKPMSGAKKSAKKRVEIDLEQPKDSDPRVSKMVLERQTDEKRIDDEMEAKRLGDEYEAKRIAARDARRLAHYNSIVPILSEWWRKKLYSGDVVDEALKHSDRINMGNALYVAWDADRFSGTWNQPCLRYDDLFTDTTGTTTCEERFASIFTSVNSDNSQLAQYLIAAFDIETMEVNPSEEIWSLRILAMRISLQNPFSFFNIDEFEANPDANHFFDGDRTNPSLRLENPLVGFWLICSELFESPWANEFLYDYYDDPPSSIVAALKQQRIDVSAKESPAQAIVKKPAPPRIQKIFDPMNSIDEAGSDVQNGLATAKMTGQGHNSNRFASLQNDDDSTEASETQETVEVQVVGVKFNGTKPPELSDDDEDSDEDEEDEDMALRENTEDTAMEEDTGVEKARPAGPNAGDSVMQGNNPSLPSSRFQSTQETSGTGNFTGLLGTPQSITRPPTIAERISNLIQVNLVGIPGKCHIFETTFSVDYQGSDSGTVAEALLSTVLSSMEEAINNSPHELKILPISDNSYKQQNLWIRTPVDLRNRISNYRALSIYCDMEYGNCPYAATNSKPGEKKLRTRLRVGFASDASVEAVQDYLHSGLRQLGRGAGCYPSPLQYGEIVKVGSCSFIPAEVNFSAYAKELMRLFDFDVPIGIKMDWVSIPYTGRAKYDERSPGVTSPHCFTRKIHAKRVDRTLRTMLHPATPKPDFPFAAPSTYISDWKSAQQGLLSVKAYGPVKDAILTLISKLRDYYILTEVLYPGIDFTGMFKFSTTRLYGSCTLFKLLLSIKATPAQADQASTAAKDKALATIATDDDSSDEEDALQEGAGSQSGVFKKVIKKKVKKKQKKRSPADDFENHFLKDLSPAQRKLAEVTDRKLQNDLDRHKAGPLFLMILPGEMEGSYIFVCRKKYGQLARNVLKGIVPFLIHHLCESTNTQADRVLGKWIPKSEILATRRKRLVWCTTTLRAIEASDQPDIVEETLEFLDDVIEDTTDVYQGQLSIDMDMANAKDIDDGQTVTGMLDEMHEREQQLEDAFVEIEARDNALAQQKAVTAALQAQLDALQRQTAQNLAISSNSDSNNEVSPDRSEFTTPPKKRKNKDTMSVQKRMVRSTTSLKQPPQPPRSNRPSLDVNFQRPKPRSVNPAPESQIQVDTTQMEGDTTTAVSQDESQTSSLTAASPGGVHPFFLPSPTGKSVTSGSAKSPPLAGRGASRSTAGP